MELFLFWRLLIWFLKVRDAELEKRNSEEKHQIVTSQCAKCEKKLKELEKKFSKSIKKAGWVM